MLEETQSLITPFKKDVLSACSVLGPVLGKKVTLPSRSKQIRGRKTISK